MTNVLRTDINKTPASVRIGLCLSLRQAQIKFYVRLNEKIADKTERVETSVTCHFT
jgi:hypothetical protein